MTLKLIRFYHGTNDTLGYLLIDGKFACFTLEDEYRAEKKMAETRIPDGKYLLKLRNYGTHAQRYGHPMIEIANVPGFTDILIHKGNTERDTAGCLLVGNAAIYNPNGNSYVGESGLAYDRIYPIIAAAIPSSVSIEVISRYEVPLLSTPPSVA